MWYATDGHIINHYAKAPHVNGKSLVVSTLQSVSCELKRKDGHGPPLAFAEVNGDFCSQPKVTVWHFLSHPL